MKKYQIDLENNQQRIKQNYISDNIHYLNGLNYQKSSENYYLEMLKM